MPASKILGVWRTAFTVNQRAGNKADSQAKQHQKKVIHLLLLIVRKAPLLRDLRFIELKLC